MSAGYRLPDLLIAKLRAAPQAVESLWAVSDSEQRFTRGLAALDAFVRREGHARVAAGHIESGFKLGTWVSSKRTRRVLGKLPMNQVASLDDRKGWTWDAPDRRFAEGLSVLEAFVGREGHARVPQQHSEAGYKLGSWVQHRREEWSLGRLTGDRVLMLERIPGWAWVPTEQWFSKSLAALDAYILREGHARVPAGHTESGIKLGSWVSDKRAKWRRGTLAKDQASLLEGRRGWAWDATEQRFSAGLSHLDLFISREGHARVPQSHLEAGFRLGSWVRTHRNGHRRGILSVKRTAALENRASWLWDARLES